MSYFAYNLHDLRKMPGAIEKTLRGKGNEGFRRMVAGFLRARGDTPAPAGAGNAAFTIRRE